MSEVGRWGIRHVVWFQPKIEYWAILGSGALEAPTDTLSLGNSSLKKTPYRGARIISSRANVVIHPKRPAVESKPLDVALGDESAK